jgi:hypothetical protein
VMAAPSHRPSLRPPPTALAKSPAEAEVEIHRSKKSKRYSQHFSILVPSLLLLCQTSYALVMKLHLANTFYDLSLHHVIRYQRHRYLLEEV